jgi:hypothetical protein
MRAQTPTGRWPWLVALGLCLGALVALVMSLGIATRSRKGHNHAKQIMIMVFGYVQDNGGRLPSLHSPNERVPAALYRQETLGSFAILSVWANGDLPPQIFWPKSLGVSPPRAPARADGGGWLDQPAMFAFDWSAPGERGLRASRPVLASRDPSAYEGAGITIAFGDGHYEFLRSVPGHAETPPVRESDPPLPWSVPHIGDDLFTSAGDGPGMDVVGGGSATRCFLK